MRERRLDIEFFNITWWSTGNCYTLLGLNTQIELDKGSFISGTLSFPRCNIYYYSNERPVFSIQYAPKKWGDIRYTLKHIKDWRW